MSPCPHKDFKASVDVYRLLDAGAFMADVRIECANCGHKFTFPKMGSGIRHDRAMTSIDGTELHIPIKPQGQDAFPKFPVEAENHNARCKNQM